MLELDAVKRGMPNIQPGGAVIQRTSWGSTRDKMVFRVKSITRTGRIRLDDGRLFSQDGIRKEPGWGIFVLEVVK